MRHAFRMPEPVKHRSVIVLLVLLVAGGLAFYAAHRPSAQAARPQVAGKVQEEPGKMARINISCPPGFHVYSENPPACEADPPTYGPEASYRGTLEMQMEAMDFFSAEDPRAGAERRPVWLTFANPALENCMTRMAASRLRPVRFPVVFRGRLAHRPGGEYGHLGMYDREIQVTEFLQGNPCRHR